MLDIAGNYAAANTYQDMLAQYRVSKGLKATSLDLGAIFGVGHIAETEADEVRVKIWEQVSLNEQELYAVMDAAMRGESVIGEKLPSQLVTGVNPDVLNQPHLHWNTDPKFSIIKRAGVADDSMTDEDEAKTKLLEELTNCTSLAAAAKAIEDALVAKMAKSMMVNKEDINVTKPLHSFGVDSLVAVEVRNWIFKELKSEVTVFDLMDPQPVTALVMRIAERSKLVGEKLKQNEASG